MNSADESSAQSNGASAFDAALDFRERLLANNWPDESELLELLKDQMALMRNLILP
ncbi:hypothetical protein H3V53_35640 [Paraburkholderia bengalensis]|uniref:Uncharacterized protein n=1 Tax=Paraburkholderia bengalensis TaxID=2747562 RepID=A0ABU8J2V1_9BURK